MELAEQEAEFRMEKQDCSLDSKGRNVAVPLTREAKRCEGCTQFPCSILTSRSLALSASVSTEGILWGRRSLTAHRPSLQVGSNPNLLPAWKVYLIATS